MKKIIFIHNSMAPYRRPLFEAFSNLPDLDFKLLICYAQSRWDYFPKTYRFNYKILPGITFQIKSKGLTFSLNPTIVFEIIRMRPDAVIIGETTNPTMQIAYLLAKILKIPTILGTENTKNLMKNSILARVLTPFRNHIYCNIDSIVVPGKESYLFSVEEGKDASKVFIAPNSIDNDFFINLSKKYKIQKTTQKKQLNLDKKILILYVGRMIREKGPHILLEAFQRIRSEFINCALIFLGDGEYKNTLINQVNDNAIQDVFFIESGKGFDKIVKYYAISDIFILPTIRPESWGMVINEAMACGLPVIATDICPASLEMIRPGVNGFIVSPGNVEQLYDAIRRLVTNTRLLKNAGKESINIITQIFNVDNQVSGFIKAVNYAIKKRQINLTNNK